MRWKRSSATRRCMLQGCGRPEFGGRTTGRCSSPPGPGWMWSPRVRGADDRSSTGRASRSVDVVAPSSGGGRQGISAGHLPRAGCGRPEFGGRTTGSGAGTCPRGRDVVAPSSGGGRQAEQVEDLHDKGCGRPGFGGRTTGTGGRAGTRLRMWSPRVRGRTMSGMAPRVAGATPWKPAARTAPDTGSERGTGSTTAGGRALDDAVDFK